uniref:Uncharacterized protein n=1 Tax=Rhizophora mucronata TaxID=61149 RepID=A0A2P2M3X7_RHIMU
MCLFLGGKKKRKRESDSVSWNFFSQVLVQPLSLQDLCNGLIGDCSSYEFRLAMI